MNSFGILTFCFLLVGGMAGDLIIMSSPSTPPYYPRQWIYNEPKRIDLLCYHTNKYPVYWKPVTRDPNPTRLLPTILSLKNENVNPIQLNITFLFGFVPRVHVTCYSPRDKKSTTVHIEVYYLTSDVEINDGVSKITVTPSENSPTVKLRCTADGNPDPTYGYWYQKTEDGNVTVSSTASRDIAFTFINDTEFSYQCEAKNSIQQDWVTSPWVKVSGFDVIKPSFVLLVSSVLFLLNNRL